MTEWFASGLGVAGLAQGLFWASLALLAYVYVGYPLLLLLVASLVPRRQALPLDDDQLPSLSMLIAAYNEEKHVGKKLRDTLALDYPADKLEVLVLSDASTDRTDDIVRACADPRVRLLRIKERRGKTHAQNEGVAACRGEVVVFSDATTLYHPRALRYLASNYQDPGVGAASGRYQYFDPEGTSPTGSGTIAFWNYENLIKAWQSRISTISGCCGCIYSVRRRVYTPLPDAIISDLVQPLWVIKQGYRVVFEDRALAHEETTKSTAEEFSMRVRIVSRAILGILSVADLLNPLRHGWVAFQLLSHKVLRWLVPIVLLLLLASNAILALAPGAFRALFATQILFYASALLAAWVPMVRWWKPLTIPLYFCTLNAAALMSLIEVSRGRRYTVWNTVRR